jgi:hypothetical protein
MIGELLSIQTSETEGQWMKLLRIFVIKDYGSGNITCTFPDLIEEV